MRKKVLKISITKTSCLNKFFFTYNKNLKNSDVTGFNVGYTYTHRSSTYNLTENDTTCRVKTVGRGVFGVTIGDFEAGIPHTVNMEDYWVLTNE